MKPKKLNILLFFLKGKRRARYKFQGKEKGSLSAIGKPTPRLMKGLLLLLDI